LAGEIEAHIKRYIDYLVSHPDVDDEVVLDALTQSGLEQYRVFELLIWVPMAFGRAVLERPEFRLPSTYQLMSADGQKFAQRRFADEPVYVEALRIATTAAGGGLPRNDFLAIAGRSAEFRAVNDALLKGSELKNLAPSEPVVSFPDQSSEPRQDTKRPWWKFW
jgi:hypothetical protein